MRAQVMAHRLGLFRYVLEPVLLHPQHLDELLAPDPQRAQRLALFIRQLAQRRLRLLAIKRQYPRIDLVGLGQLPDALGELAHSARIDDYHRQLRRPQTRNQHALVRTTLDQHPLAAGLPKPLGDALDRARLVGFRELLALRAQLPHQLLLPTSIAAFTPPITVLLRSFTGALTPPCSSIRARLCAAPSTVRALLRLFWARRFLLSCGLIGPGVVELPRPGLLLFAALVTDIQGVQKVVDILLEGIRPREVVPTAVAALPHGPR